MPKYVKIENPAILEEIIHTTFEDRQKIDDLVKLEQYVKNGAHSMASSMQFRLLRSTYPEQYLAFLQDESPERYQAELQRQADEKAEKQRQAEKTTALEELERQDWLAAGGLR